MEPQGEEEYPLEDMRVFPGVRFTPCTLHKKFALSFLSV